MGILSLLLKDNVVGFSRSGKESIFSLRLALELQTLLQNHLGKKKRETFRKGATIIPFSMLQCWRDLYINY